MPTNTYGWDSPTFTSSGSGYYFTDISSPMWTIKTSSKKRPAIKDGEYFISRNLGFYLQLSGPNVHNERRVRLSINDYPTAKVLI